VNQAKVFSVSKKLVIESCKFASSQQKSIFSSKKKNIDAGGKLIKEGIMAS
jgi:hypothetical protein